MKKPYSDMNSAERNDYRISLTKQGSYVLLSLFAFGLLYAFKPCVIIEGGEHGVVREFGEIQPSPLPEGIHWVKPWANVTHINTKTSVFTIKGDGASKDLQHVSTNVALNYSLNPSTLPQFMRQVGLGYTTTLIDPAVQESFKAVTALYTAEELITKRDDVKSAITSNIKTKLEALSGGGINVIALSITNFDFSASFNQAIEAKTVANQNALKAERDLIRIRTESEQEVVKAQAVAASLKAQKEEITDKLLELRRIENQKLAIAKWDGKLPVYALGGATPMIQLEGK